MNPFIRFISNLFRAKPKSPTAFDRDYAEMVKRRDRLFKEGEVEIARRTARDENRRQKDIAATELAAKKELQKEARALRASERVALAQQADEARRRKEEDRFKRDISKGRRSYRRTIERREERARINDDKRIIAAGVDSDEEDSTISQYKAALERQNAREAARLAAEELRESNRRNREIAKEEREAKALRRVEDRELSERARRENMRADEPIQRRAKPQVEFTIPEEAMVEEAEEDEIYRMNSDSWRPYHVARKENRKNGITQETEYTQALKEDAIRKTVYKNGRRYEV